MFSLKLYNCDIAFLYCVKGPPKIIVGGPTYCVCVAYGKKQRYGKYVPGIHEGLKAGGRFLRSRQWLWWGGFGACAVAYVTRPVADVTGATARSTRTTRVVADWRLPVRVPGSARPNGVSPSVRAPGGSLLIGGRDVAGHR